MRKLIAIFLILAPLTFTFAASDLVPVATIIVPTMRVGDIPLSPSEIAKSTLYCGVKSGGPYNLYNGIFQGASTMLVLDGQAVTNGWHYCVITTTDTDGLESAPTSESSFFIQAGLVVNPLVPAAPSGLKFSNTTR